MTQGPNMCALFNCLLLNCSSLLLLLIISSDGSSDSDSVLVQIRNPYFLDILSIFANILYIVMSISANDILRTS